jgi:hypothetical protein
MTMTLILLQAIIQSTSATLSWIGLYVGIRALPGEKSRRLVWTIGSAVVTAVWLVGVMLLGANDVFRTNAVAVAMALLTTFAAGYLLLLSRTFRAIVSGIPQHWLIGIQTFRIIGIVFLVRYFQGQLPGVFAIPAGLGDGGGIVFPIVLIPTYAVPRSFLIHSYSLVGLLRKTSRHSAPADYRSEGGNVWNSRSLESARS